MMETIENQRLISWRRWFHMHPETAGKEKDTAAYLTKELSRLGLTVKENIFGYGIVAELNGTEEGKCIALRADMDALPIEEQTDLDFKSLTPGVMHACGHDAHMAVLLGTAARLVQDPPPGRVKFIFQPSEEKPPGGAKYLIEAGVLNNPDVDAVIGFHVSPSYPVGTVALKEGVMTGIADDFELTIMGRGGHGAVPHLTVDTILVTAQVIQGLQHIISRKVDPTEPALLSLGTIHGGTTQNIIPDQVVLTGTVRSTSQMVRERIINSMNQTLNGITKAWEADYKLNYLYGYPPVVNDPGLTRVIMDVVRDQAEFSLQVMEKPVMIGEDFAYYGIPVPAAYFFLGCGSEEKKHSLHHNSFDIEEACLPLGVKVMSEAVQRFLKG
ncbi:MAG: amidohydrolase [Dehalobacterium sp.]